MGWPLLELGPNDLLTTQDCVTGIHIFGATGSGKTSGSVAALAQAMLRDGWGFLVHTTRLGEADQWEEWATRCGRAEDVLRIRPDGRHHFNFLNYLAHHPQAGVSIEANIGDILMNLAKHARPQGKPSETSQFFTEAALSMATKAIHLLKAAGEPLTLERIGKVIQHAPNHPSEVREEYFREEYLAELIAKAHRRMDEGELQRLVDFWTKEIPRMNERTRGDVVSTLTSVVHRFTEPPIKDLIASEKGNSYIPELIDTGKVMILDCPIVSYSDAGRLYQIAIKYLVQKAILLRRSSDRTRPVVIFADEAQNFATQYDYTYQAICRDNRACTVYATQTIDNYRDAIGSEHAVEALLASLGVKIFHANSGNTNAWGSKLIADDIRNMGGTSLSQRDDKGSPQFGMSSSEQFHPQIPPEEFTRLRTGGQRNNMLVDAIIFQAGRIFNQTKRPYMRVTFRQGQ